MERKTEFWIIGGFIVLVIIVAIAAFVFSPPSSAPQNAFNATRAAAITSADHARGNLTSATTVIEYGDFECPACGAYEPIVEQLTAQYGDRVKFVFRNFPLTQVHPFAMIAAQAAEAADLQGKYWQMHDLLYKKQTTWSGDTSLSPQDIVTKYFNAYAQQLGLDVSKFDTDINSDAVKSRVQKDIDSGNAAKVDHTPTFFIDLTQIPNPNSLQEFQNDINTALGTQGGAATTSAK